MKLQTKIASPSRCYPTILRKVHRTNAPWFATLLSAAALMVLPVQSATITIEHRDGDLVTALLLRGEIKPGDNEKLLDLKGRLKNPIVYLESTGGNIGAALDIGLILRDVHAITAVRRNKTCASACGLIWLAGTYRYAGKRSRVGFHASYEMHGRKAEQSGVGNALVGAYLTRLGYDLDVIVYATSAKPEDMNWLNSDIAKRLSLTAFFGIEPRSPELQTEPKWLPKPVPRPLGIETRPEPSDPIDAELEGLTYDGASTPASISPLVTNPAANDAGELSQFEKHTEEEIAKPSEIVIPRLAVPSRIYPVPMPGKSDLHQAVPSEQR